MIVTRLAATIASGQMGGEFISGADIVPFILADENDTARFTG
ncbi:MAG: hypothetical protein WDN06_02780 [Asticcacaulis sp.]